MSLGRRLRPLGPLRVRIAAPREPVFDQIAAAYLAPRPSRQLREKIRVLSRKGEVVVAEHRTRVGRFTAVTVERITLVRPSEVRFQLLSGPVPHVEERFLLREAGGDTTELQYQGELGTDLWQLGALWGAFVAHYWERTVAQSLVSLTRVAEEAVARRGEARAMSDP